MKNTHFYLKKYQKLTQEVQKLFRVYAQIESGSSPSKKNKINVEKALLSHSNQFLTVCTYLKNNGHEDKGEIGLKKSIYIFHRFGDYANQSVALNNLAVLYEKSGRLDEAFDAYKKAVEIYENNVEISGKNSDANLANKGNVFNGYACCLDRLIGNHKEAIKYYLKALELRSTITTEPPVKLAKTNIGLGLVFIKIDKFFEAERYLTAGVKVIKNATTSQPNFVIPALLGLAKINVFNSFPSQFFSVAQNIITAATPARHTSQVNLRTLLSPNSMISSTEEKDIESTSGLKVKLYHRVYKYAKEALTLIEASPDLIAKTIPLRLEALEYLCLSATNIGYYDEAVNYAEKVYSILKNLKSASPVKVIKSLISLAEAYQGTEKFDIALEYYHQASERLSLDNTITLSDVLKVSILSGQALVHFKLHRYEDAISGYQKALAFHKKNFGENSILVAEVHSNLAAIYEKLDRLPEMKKCCEQAITVFEKSLGPSSIGVARATLNLGVLYSRKACYEDANICYNKVLDIYLECYGEMSDETQKILNNLALNFYHRKLYQLSKTYYERALSICKILCPDGSVQMATTLTNYANLQTEMHEIDFAEKNYQNALKILEKTNNYYSPKTAKICDGLGKLYVRKNQHEQAILFFELSLIIKRKIYPLYSSEIGETLIFLAEVSGSTKTSEQMLIEALKHYENVHLGDSYKACEAHLLLAEEYVRQGSDITHDAERNNLYHAALLQYKKVLTINHEQIADLKIDFIEEDMCGHLALLAKIANVYCFQNQSEEAGKVFADEAIKLRDNFPRSSLVCLSKAIHYYAQSTKTQPMRAELLISKIEHYNNSPNILLPWATIFNDLSEATLLAKNKNYSALYEKNANAFQHLFSHIESDLFFQYERCVNLYYELDNLLLIQTDDDSFEYAQNKAIDLLINLRNILDQSYGRLLSRIFKDHYHKKLPPFYFPIYGSIDQFNQLLAKYNLFSGYILITSKKIKVKNPDPNKHQDPPSVEEILTALENCRVLEKVEKNYYRWINFNSSQKNISWEKSDLERYPSLVTYTQQILKKIKKMYVNCQTTFDVVCQQSYEGIIGAQPFTYYNPNQADNNIDSGEQSWLDKLALIVNDSKHVRICLQKKKVDIQKQKGTIQKAHRTFQIKYQEKRFDPWCFYKILPSSLSVVERLNLSRIIRDLLKSTRHIVGHTVSHPLTQEYNLNFQKKRLPEELAYIKDRYLEAIKKDLLSIQSSLDDNLFNPITSSICNDMLQRATHRIEPSSLENYESLDLQVFIKQVMLNVYELMDIFSQDVEKFYLNKVINISDFPKASLDLSFSTQYKQWYIDLEGIDQSNIPTNQIRFIEDYLNNFQNQQQSLENLNLSELQIYHKRLTQLDIIYSRQSWLKKIGKLYEQAAFVFASDIPLLATIYFKQALIKYQQTNSPKEVSEMVMQLYYQYEAQELTCKSNVLLKQVIKNGVYDGELLPRNKVLNSEQNLENSDIISQLQYAKENLFNLRLDWIKYCIFPARTNSMLNEIQTQVFEIMIRIRHNLDHAFRRLLRMTVLNPNQDSLGSETLYNFPTKCDTEVKLSKGLRARKAIENPSEKNDLESSCIQVIRESQTKAWFKTMIQLTNVAKHEKPPELIPVDFSCANEQTARLIENMLIITPSFFAINLLTDALSETKKIILHFLFVIECYNESCLTSENTLFLTPEILKNRGNTFAGQQKYFEALACYNKCVELYPSYATAWCNKGLMHKRLQQYSDAIIAFKKAIELDSSYTKAKYQFDECLRLLDENESTLDFSKVN